MKFAPIQDEELLIKIAELHKMHELIQLAAKQFSLSS
ncbi:hypothetical protein FSP39_013363 [Pinctada imbricata]|uniref:Uncharacterized protein n=1 Tax=Pinctada imbricata TaxID=66713 RepID=A0AA88YJ04_PINIB|nr:hypothetical protein FSP39_013363 [Pinctada imbricata]